FIGSPAMNLLDARLERSNGGLEASLGQQRLPPGDELLPARPALNDYEGRNVVLGVRPEQLDDAALVPDASEDRRIRGKVELREALGSELMVHFRLEAPPALTEEVKELAEDAGTTAEELAGGASSTIVVGRFAPHSKVREGDEAEIAVDTRSLHFFDTETGTAIYDGSNETKGASARRPSDGCPPPCSPPPPSLWAHVVATTAAAGRRRATAN